MPLYDFTCNDCGRDFEVILMVSEYDPKKVKCPECGSADVKRRFLAVQVVTSRKS